MKLNNKICKIIMIVFIALSAGLSYFRFDMLKDNKAIDELGLYTDRAAGNLFGSLVFVLIALTVVFAFILSKGTLREKKTGVMHNVSAAFSMIMMLVTVISAGTDLAGGKFSVLPAIELIFAVGAAAYFLMETINGAKAKEVNKYSLMALLPALYFAFSAIRLFMNVETQINASNRSFTLLFLVVMMMFFMSEAEYSVPLGKLEQTEKENIKRDAKYAGFGLVAFELAIIFFASQIFADISDATAVANGVCNIALAFFAIVRVF